MLVSSSFNFWTVEICKPVTIRYIGDSELLSVDYENLYELFVWPDTIWILSLFPSHVNVSFFDVALGEARNFCSCSLSIWS